MDDEFIQKMVSTLFQSIDEAKVLNCTNNGCRYIKCYRVNRDHSRTKTLLLWKPLYFYLCVKSFRHIYYLSYLKTYYFS